MGNVQDWKSLPHSWCFRDKQVYHRSWPVPSNNADEMTNNEDPDETVEEQSGIVLHCLP